MMKRLIISLTKVLLLMAWYLLIPSLLSADNTPMLINTVASSDTLQPPFATHACDLVCPDFQVNWGTSSATCGQSDGSAQVIPVGFPDGTTFTYFWTDDVSNTNTATGLSAGIYFVTVDVDVSGNGSFRNCVVVVEVLVDNIDGPTVSTSTKPADCLSQNGKVFFNITEGTPPFTISWGNNTEVVSSLGQTVISGFGPGEYTFSITDANGCLTTVKDEVVEANEDIFGIDLQVTAPSACGQSDGTLTVTVSGGYPPYIIVLNNIVEQEINGNSFTFTGLASGLYTVDVTDNFLCSEVDESIEMNVSCPPSLDGWQGVDADCSDGIGYLIFDGSGSPNEIFEVRQLESVFVIQEINGATSAIIEVPLGAYKIKRISLDDDCICEIRIDISAPPPLEVKIETVDENCGADGLPDGQGRISVVEVNGGTAPYNITIKQEDGTVIDISNTFELLNLSAGIYEISVIDANNCQPIIFQDTLLGPNVIESGLGNQLTICKNVPYQIEGGNPALQYSWSPSTGLSDAMSPNPTITLGDDLTYIITVTDPNLSGCNTTVDTLVVALEPAINLTITNDTIACGANSTIIEANTSSQVTIDSILWLDEFGILVNTGNTYELTSAEVGNNYTVIAYSQNTCTDTATFTLLTILDEVIEIQALPTDTIICEGNSVTFSASLNPANNPAASVSWFDINTGLEVATGLSYTSSPTQGMYEYIAVVSGDCIIPDTASVTLEVINIIPPSPIDTNFIVCIGDTIKYDIGAYPYSYQWQDNNGAIIATDAPLCVEANTLGTQEYIFVSTNACGTVFDTLMVEVFGEVQLEIQPDTTILLNAALDTVCLTTNFSAPEYLVWSASTGNVIGMGEELCILPPIGESTYILSAPGLECINPDTAIIIVIDEPLPPPIDTTLKICVGDTIKYDVDPYPFPYQWEDINGNILGVDVPLCVVANNVGSNLYLFKASGSFGVLTDTLEVLVFEEEALVIQPDSTITLCAPADTVCLSVSFAAPECIVWTDLDGNELGTGEELCVVPPLGESQYIASVPDLACIASDTVTIMVSELPPPPLPDTTFKLCVGDTLKYELADYPFPYQWKDINGNVLTSDSSLCEVMPQGGTQQYIFMSMSSCGMLSDTLDVLVFEEEALVIQPDSTITLCAPADTVCLSVSFAAPECIVWTDLDGNELGTGEELCVVPPLGESQYIASVPDLACIASDTVTIMVSELPPPPLPDTTFKLCVGDTLKYELADYPFPYQWKDINGNVLASDSSLCEVMTQGGTQQYIFMSMSSCGMLSDTLDVLVFEDEQLVIQPDSTITLCAPADTVCLSVSFAAPECIVWTDLDGNELGTGEELCVVPPLGESQYIASVPDLACITSDTVTIMVSELPPPPLPDTTFKLCVGDTLKYELADYPFPYQWKDINGNILTSDKPMRVMTQGGMQEYIFMSMSSCGMLSDTLDVLVFEDEQLVIQPDSTITLCAPADTVCLSVSFAAPECIVWTDLEGNELGTGEELCVVPPLGESQYIASVPDLDCVASDTVTIMVSELPPPPLPDTTFKLCVGDTLKYELADYPFPYQWKDINGNVLLVTQAYVR
jgi:hypothetical protein